MKIYQLWKKHAFTVAVAVSIIIILVTIISRVGKTGTFSTYELYFTDNPRPKNIKPTNSKGETECRQVLESIFHRPFPKARPDFLRNNITGGHNLEIDCFCAPLKLGVEYSGRQHYEYVPFFHKTKDAFYNQRYRDDMKKRLCEKNGIKLIVVPYTVKNIRQYLVNELRKYNFN